MTTLPLPALSATRLEDLPRGHYRVILADPPWTYRQAKGSDGLGGGAAPQYDLMSVDDICDLPVAELAAERCALFCWATNSLIQEALRVVEAWGFDYKTNICWVKNRIGCGFHVRGQHELLLIATRGGGTPAYVPPSVLRAPRRQHSRKPDGIHDLIEAMYPTGPYLELFARTRRRGWTVFGNEVGKFPMQERLFR